jgi:undecaprenyl-diphosphatase
MSGAPEPGKSQASRRWWLATWSWKQWTVLGVCAVVVAAMICADSELRGHYRALVSDRPELGWLAHKITKGLHLHYVLLMVCAACLAARTRWREVAKAMTVGIGVQAIVIAVLKDLIGRDRPIHTDGVSVFHGPEWGSHSMPSGHAGLAFVLATVLSRFFPRGRWVFYPLAVLAGLARVHVDRHFFSDVFAGGVVGVLVGQWALWRFARAAEPEAAPSPGPE